jgi:MFS family permease
MSIPAVATTMAIIFLRTATNGVQSSIYVVYLNGIGLTGTSIGTLFAAIEITSGLGSLFAGRAMRLGDPQRTMLSGTVLSILLICITPFFGGAFALLFAAQASRGWLQGVVQPMMFSVQAKAVGPHRQGSVVGLRQTMNRLAAIVIPPLVGSIADHWGAAPSFVILGAGLIVLCAPVTLITRRAAGPLQIRRSRRRVTDSQNGPRGTKISAVLARPEGVPNNLQSRRRTPAPCLSISRRGHRRPARAERRAGADRRPR